MEAFIFAFVALVALLTFVAITTDFYDEGTGSGAGGGAGGGGRDIPGSDVNQN